MKSNDRFTQLLSQLDELGIQNQIPESYAALLKRFFQSYHSVIVSHQKSLSAACEILEKFLSMIVEQFVSPYRFEPFHRAVRAPFDYYHFGLDFLRPLVDLPHSSLHGQEHLKEMVAQLKRKENVILLSNHQIEADPQAISILLEKVAPEFAENLIFVAGTKVTTDPLAIPFSMGINLLCIHSKKYIDNPPSKQHEKQLFNKRTMQRMSELLSDGGWAIYVAPSGGRDRANKEGVVLPAPFDPQSIEMFYLMAQKAKRPTHFYTLALSTYHLLPPPEAEEATPGEERITRGGAIHVGFGKEVDMENYPGVEQGQDKHEKRKIRAEYLWNLVQKDYEAFPER